MVIVPGHNKTPKTTKRAILRHPEILPPEVKREVHLKAQTVSDEHIEEIIEAMGVEGTPLKRVCEDHRVSYMAVIHRIMRNPRLTVLDRAAREQFLRLQIRRMNEIVETEEDPQKARLMCDNLKWEIARVIPREYGDRIIHAGDDAAPLQIKLVADADEMLNKIKGAGTMKLVNKA